MPVTFFGHTEGLATGVTSLNTSPGTEIDGTACSNPVLLMSIWITDKTNGAIGVEARSSGHAAQSLAFFNFSTSLSLFEVEQWAIIAPTMYTDLSGHVELLTTAASATIDLVLLGGAFQTVAVAGHTSADENVSSSAFVAITGNNGANLFISTVAFDDSPHVTAHTLFNQGAEIVNVPNDLMGPLSHYVITNNMGQQIGYDLTSNREWCAVVCEYAGPTVAVKDVIHAGGHLVYAR